MLRDVPELNMAKHVEADGVFFSLEAKPPKVRILIMIRTFFKVK